jgi:hypothetical protein
MAKSFPICQQPSLDTPAACADGAGHCLGIPGLLAVGAPPIFQAGGSIGLVQGLAVDQNDKPVTPAQVRLQHGKSNLALIPAARPIGSPALAHKEYLVEPGRSGNLILPVAAGKQPALKPFEQPVDQQWQSGTRKVFL